LPKSADWSRWPARRASGPSREASSAPATAKWRPAPRFSAEPRAALETIGLFIATLIFGLAGGTPPAAAQVSATVAIESDFRLRGYSMSAGRPIASVRIGFDHETGVYADGSAAVVAPRDDHMRFLGFQVDAGIARRVGERWTVDLGIAHNEWDAAYDGTPAFRYTEGYLGVTRAPFSAYLFLSPNYLRPGCKTVYGQVEATVSPADHWHVTTHLGSLNYLDTPAADAVEHEIYWDWRIGVTREFGNAELHAAISGGGPGREYQYGGLRSRTAVTGGASLSF
jgi:uncharacterized protein (TIGR02001 family)